MVAFLTVTEADEVRFLYSVPIQEYASDSLSERDAADNRGR